MSEENEEKTQDYITGAPPRDNKDIPVTKRYARREPRVALPGDIPWENSAALETQQNMGAFGKTRYQVMPVEDGKLELKQGSLHSENILTRFAETRFASQTGASPFGAHRENVYKTVSAKEIDPEKARLSEGVIPLQSGTNKNPGQAGETPIGSIRNQVPLVKYKADMSGLVDPESDTFLTRMNCPNPNNKGGQFSVRRPIAPRQKIEHVKETESILPCLSDRFGICEPVGTNAGQQGMSRRRQVVTEVDDGEHARQTYADLVASKHYVPWSQRAQMEGQEGSGGFNKVRDVVPPIVPIL